MGADIRDWFQAFYETSDDGTEHEKYTAFFSPDAMLIMGDKTAIGRNDILKLREGMWSAVASRKHTYTYYGSPDKPDTYLLEGEVTYGFKAGGEGTVKWVAKAEFEGDGPERQLRFYQVFLNAGSR